jgi:tRNA modification GTPase
MTNRTIAAIATPLGPGGIGIIRISGPEAYGILQRLFVRQKKEKEGANRSHPASNCLLQSHRVYYGHIIEPGTESIIDEVLAIYMKGPKSFTREDVVEIHSHSGFVVLDRILSAVVDAGAGISRPGEFSKRAFLNGRIDLTQAEGIIDLINAPGETAARMASQHLAGGARDAVQNIIDKLNALQAKCEAGIEFFENSDDQKIVFEVSENVRKQILPFLSSLIQRQKESAIFREGLHLAIAGSPNVGKSSLLNRLVQREAAIVSEWPGTTRDVVREYISINGVPIIVCDTAGIRESKDPVECIGIERARDQIMHADIVLLVLDGSRALNNYEESLLDEIYSCKNIVVVNKADVINERVAKALEKRIEKHSWIRVSAKNGTHIDKLKALIFKDIVHEGKSGSGPVLTPNLRQRKILEKARAELNVLIDKDAHSQSIDIVSDGLKTVSKTLQEISGAKGKEDLYDHIFSQFCVGK